MKVLFVCSLYYPHAGGIETIIRELSSIYKKRGIEVAVLTKRWPIELPEYDEYEGVKIYRIISAKNISDFSSNIKFLIKNNENLKPDTIHVIGIRKPLPLLAYILSRFWKVPLVVTISGGDIPDPFDSQPRAIWSSGKTIVEPVINRADWINTFSKDLIHLTKQTFPDLNEVSLIYAGIDLKKIKEIKKTHLKYPYILSLRRLDPSKGVDLTIKAFKKISVVNPNLKLVIVGEGTEYESLRLLTEKLKLTDRVEFTGKLSLEDSLSLLKGAILTVVPSLSEGGGLINLEAQACGCPLIASRVGGIPEYAKESYSALMFDSGNVEDLADKIKLILNDFNLRKKLVYNGKNYVKKFDSDNIVDKYLKGYNSLISKDINYTFKHWSKLSLNLWKGISMGKNSEKILQLINQFGISNNVNFKLIRETDYNSVYLVDTSPKSILRVSKRINEKDLLFELDLIEYLYKKGFKVARWLPTIENKPYGKLKDTTIGTLFEFIKGKSINFKTKPDLMAVSMAGQALGTLHSQTVNYTPKHKRNRNIYSEFERVLKDKEKFSEYYKNGKQFINKIEDMMSFAKNQNVKQGVINNDYRVSNVLFNNMHEVTAVLDFDWSCIGPLVKDLALGVVEWSFPDGSTEPWEDILNEFLKGYNITSPEKWNLNYDFKRWIMFACLSDACTYFADLMNDKNNNKKEIKSYMYNKYLFFERIKL